MIEFSIDELKLILSLCDNELKSHKTLESFGFAVSLMSDLHSSISNLREKIISYFG